jgi:hypothetical protein
MAAQFLNIAESLDSLDAGRNVATCDKPGIPLRFMLSAVVVCAILQQQERREERIRVSHSFKGS